MSDFRARDADRDRAVEVIETAYVDGQLGDADRELRVSRALAAETLGELEGLTRDLQVPAAHGVRPAAPQVPTASSSRTGPRVGLVVAGVVAAVVGVLGLVPFVFLASSSDQSSSSSVEVSAPATSVEQPVAEKTPAPFEMTAGQVRRFLTGYEKKFGTLHAWEAGFYPARVGVQVPVSRYRPRFERWSWDGTWRQDTEAAAVTGPHKFVDLGTVDVRRMFGNIGRAKRTLNVPGGDLTHVLVSDWGEGPSVNIYIRNSFGESGYLKTSMSGDVIRAFPYEQLP